MKPSRIKFSFINADITNAEPFVLRGKSAAILNQLVLAGPKGITPLELQTWTTRMANMIGDYRNKYGLDIETVMEPNTGRFGGQHGRYILNSNVSVQNVQQEAA